MWNIVKESLKGSNKPKLIGFTSILLFLIGVEIAATISIPLWREYFFDGVEAKDYDVFVKGMWYFAGLMLAFVFSQGFKLFTIQKLALEWRTSLNNMLVKRWKAAHLVNVDNPDQRISEDTNIASMLAIELAVEVVISGSIIVGLVGGMSSTLLTLSAIYTVVICILAAFFHRPLINTEKNLQRAEASYRFEMAKISADGKNRPLQDKYDTVVKRYTRLINVSLGFSLFSRAKGNLMNLIPYMLLVPMYFAGDIGFGEIMKGVSQFDLLVINATILIVLYPKVTKALASYERIKEFYEDLKT